jgi:hypothetical protein
MLKLKIHSGFHDLFRFWYVQEYKYSSILWLEDGNLYLRLRKMSHTIYAANGKVSHSWNQKVFLMLHVSFGASGFFFIQRLSLSCLVHWWLISIILIFCFCKALAFLWLDERRCRLRGKSGVHLMSLLWLFLRILNGCTMSLTSCVNFEYTCQIVHV